MINVNDLPLPGELINPFKDQIGFFDNSIEGKDVLCIGFSQDDLKEFVEPYNPARIVCLTLWDDGHKDAKIDKYELVIGDISKRTDFNENTFDAIVTLSLFEHLIDINGALYEMRRILKENGYLYAHFGPAWSCAVGHHIYANEEDELLNFCKFKIPSHIHLLCNEDEIKEYYLQKGYSSAICNEVIRWFYETPIINRLMYDDIIMAFKQHFYLIASNKMYFDVDSEILSALKKRYPMYYDFTTYGGGFLLKKPAGNKVKGDIMYNNKAPKIEPQEIIDAINLSSGHKEQSNDQDKTQHSFKDILRKCVYAFYKIPVLGYLLKIAVRVVMLPRTIRKINNEITDLNIKMHEQNIRMQKELHNQNLRFREQSVRVNETLYEQNLKIQEYTEKTMEKNK